MKSELYFKIKKYIEKNSLITNGDKIVAGVSGGADSVLLFLVLAQLSREYTISLCAVHVNHGIRGEEADRDEEFSKGLVEKLGFECRVFHGDIPKMAAENKLTEEEAGRKYRYECFENVRRELGYNKIAVAHHMDDQAETMLFQLIRGSGIRGLGAMKPRNGCIIRPLLDIRRGDIERALEKEGVSYCMDSTNESDEYARNQIRNNVIPYISKNIQPAAVRHLAATAEQLRDIYAYISKTAGELYKSIVTVEDSRCTVDAHRLIKEDVVLQKEVFMCMIEHVAKKRKDITARHIDMLIELLYKDTGRVVHLPYNICAGRSYNKIWMKIRETEKPCYSNEIIDICVPGEVGLEYINGEKHTISFSSIIRTKLPDTIVKNNCTKWFDYAKIKFMPQFRHPKDGDYMWIRTDGLKKKLSRILIDSKVPAEQRIRLWVLAEESHILWIPELGRCSAYYYVTDETKDVLVFEDKGREVE